MHSLIRDIPARFWIFRLLLACWTVCGCCCNAAVVEESKPASTVSEIPRIGVELKKIGKDTWLSPGGLRYQGRDPMGLTRVEHVARHAQDIPNRDGPHGVFDGGERVAFAVIDEAWEAAVKKGLRPVAEGNRSSYTVNMGRRIGFLGGQLGASRKNPPLNRVFIVFESGTKNVVTAFPK